MVQGSRREGVDVEVMVAEALEEDSLEDREIGTIQGQARGMVGQDIRDRLIHQDEEKEVIRTLEVRV